MMGRNVKVVQSSKEEHRNLVRAEKQKALSEKQSRYQRYQSTVFTFLDRPATKIAYAYHTVNLSLILGSIIISVCSTVDYFNSSSAFTQFILYYEMFLLTWFTLEYVFRVWSCAIVSKWEGWEGRFRFMRSFYMCVDAFVITTTLTTVLLQVKHSYFTMLRITRFLQVFRVLRLDRQRGDLRTMGQVVYKHKKELVTCYFVGFIILFGGTYVIYIVEKSSSKPTIDNMANGIYWAMITLTSVGYGDISPETWAGKICTGVFALVGCAFFALPAGILGSGFALQVAKQKKEQRYTKIKNPAAIVLQNLWRNHAVKRSRYQLQGTWAFMFPQVMQHISRSGYYKLLPGVKAIHDSASFDLFRASVGRKKTTNQAKIRRTKRSSSSSACNLSVKKKKSSVMSFNSTHRSTTDTDTDNEMTMTKSLTSTSISSTPQTQRKRTKEKLPISELISGRYKAAIRFVLRVKYFTDVRKFKKERYPFVNVQDIMEKNSHNHLETLSYLKDIKNYIEEFQVELEEMKVAFRDYQIMFNTSPLKPSQGLPHVGMQNRNGGAYGGLDENLNFKDLNIKRKETKKEEENKREDNLLYAEGEIVVNGVISHPLDKHVDNSRKEIENLEGQEKNIQLSEEEEEENEMKELLPKVVTKNASNHTHAAEQIALNDLNL